MGKKFFDKVVDIMGFGDPGYEDEERDHNHPQDIEEVEDENTKKKKGTLISLPSQNQKLKIMVMEPNLYEEVQVMVEHLKAKRAVITNLEGTSPEVAKQIIDFLSGAIYALDGNLYKVRECVFVATPSNVEINAEQRKELQEKTMPFWNR